MSMHIFDLEARAYIRSPLSDEYEFLRDEVNSERRAFTNTGRNLAATAQAALDDAEDDTERAFFAGVVQGVDELLRHAPKPIAYPRPGHWLWERALARETE